MANAIIMNLAREKTEIPKRVPFLAHPVHVFSERERTNNSNSKTTLAEIVLKNSAL